MAKTSEISNPMKVFSTLTALKDTGKFEMSYHLARTYEDVGLVVPVLDHAGPGRPKKSFRISEKGITFLDKTRSAMAAATSLFLDEHGQPIHDPAKPLDINTTPKLSPREQRMAKLRAELEALEKGGDVPAKTKEALVDASGNKIDLRTKEGRALKAKLSGEPVRVKSTKRVATTGGQRESAELAELRKQLAALQEQIAANSTANPSASGETETKAVDNAGGTGNGPLVIRGPNGRFQKIDPDKANESAAA